MRDSSSSLTTAGCVQSPDDAASFRLCSRKSRSMQSTGLPRFMKHQLKKQLNALALDSSWATMRKMSSACSSGWTTQTEKPVSSQAWSSSDSSAWISGKGSTPAAWPFFNSVGCCARSIPDTCATGRLAGWQAGRSGSRHPDWLVNSRTMIRITAV